MERERLLKQITILDFMATDLHLYLNTHPCDEEAIKMYNDTVKQSASLCKEYEECYGAMVGFRSASISNNAWDWQDSPWPWQPEFNFRLTKSEEAKMENEIGMVENMPQLEGVL